jgi:DNA polymerase III epsilon subunit-like protein
MTTLVGLDFEMANPIVGSLCAYGLAYEDGSVESGVLALHPYKGGQQERQRFHGISPSETAAGFGPQVLYRRLVALPADTVLVAHDARIDRTHLYDWFDMWGLPPLDFCWFDTLRIARREYGKQGKTGVAAMAERMGLTVRAHDPADDARVALTIAQRYDWGQFKVLDKPSLIR